MPKKKTKEEFIKKAIEKHGDKYDYSKVEYVGTHTKVCIICPNPEHGEFEQTPSNHLQGHGCPKCKGDKNRERKSSNKEEFIKKASKVHGDKYNYSEVEYVNDRTKVCIKCPEHGEFWQTPHDHLAVHGCPTCGVENACKKNTSTKENFVKKANKVHNGKYNYSKMGYINNKTKICIICPEHGEFWQTPHSHTQGARCPECANEATGERCRSSKEEFIEKSRKVHGDKYDYSKVEYVNDKTKVCIKCHEHGEFWQTPNGHLQCQGCPKCSDVYVPTTEEWIASARKVHGDKYDYSKVNYVNAHTKVTIICPEHGEFWQRPSAHLNGQGCSKCNLSHLERSVMNYLDEHEIAYDYQKRFKWLGRQSLDFYLPDYNVGIECQGGQHFFPIERFGGDKTFKNTLERDKRKKALCEKHGVKLLYYGNTPNYDTFLGEAVHDDVQYLIDYLKNNK